MNSIELAIKNALELSGSSKEANKAYLEFIKANFIIPIDKDSAPEEPQVLYIREGKHTFLPAFSSMHYFKPWASEISQEIHILNLSGVDLLKGLGEEVHLCLNPGSSLYKEFNPQELARMQMMVAKLFK